MDSGSCLLKTSEMSTCEENNDLLNIFNLISNIKEDLKKLKLLGIPTDESGITDLKVNSLEMKFDLLQNVFRIRSTQR